MKSKCILFLSLVLVVSCSNDKQVKVHSKDLNQVIQMEIANLKSLEDKRQFLKNILEDDQAVRGEKGAQIILKFGKDSKEDRAYVEAQWGQDSINLIKIEAYLNRFPYPSVDSLGKEASLTPWIVIHHSKTNEIRDRYFETFYQAYLMGNITDTQISMCLGRFYQRKFGSRFDMESPYTYEDEINALIKALGLEERQLQLMNLPST